jgi:DNA-binding NtrC family response regulator
MAAKILLVLSPSKRALLLPALDGEIAKQKMEIEWALGFQDAVRKLSEGHSYDLLMVDAELPDGSWRNLALFLQNSGMTAEMIICARHDERELWADAIQSGAYDLIAEPFEPAEVSRTVESALESRYMRRFTRPVPAKPGAVSG